LKPNVTPEQLIAKLDTNHDGKISAAEFKAPQLQGFDKIDTNHDGVITPQEAAAAQRR
jgi:Ca2+-binding EF-hand superfamily protein